MNDYTDLAPEAPIHFSHQNYRGITGRTLAIRAPETEKLDLAVATKMKIGLPATIRIEAGIAKVNPGNQARYDQLKRAIRNARKSASGESPEEKSLAIGKLQEEAARVKPDRYCRKTGRERAQANMRDVTAVITLAVVSAKGTTYTLKAGTQEIYLFATHGSRWAYMTSAQPSYPYSDSDLF